MFTALLYFQTFPVSI